MKQAFWVTFLTLCFCKLSSAQAGKPSSFSFYSYYGNKVYEARLTPKLLESSPAWLEGEDNPPLSAGRAIEIASAAVRELFPDFGKWRKVVIKLHPVGEKWVYVVEFDKPIPEDARNVINRHPSFGIVVLMNGEVVKPVVRIPKAA